MSEERFIGIDLNGLTDVAVIYDLTPGVGETLQNAKIVGGYVPSVVVLAGGQGQELRLVAGREATMAIEGRGWDWPESASRSGRVPVSAVLEALFENKEVKVGAFKSVDASRMAGEVIRALLQESSEAEDRVDNPITLAIRDNGTINEDVQQKLLQAAEEVGARITLLWRPVAALLALEGDLNAIAEPLRGKTIGVISLMDDGLDVSRLVIRTASDSQGTYVVPERRAPGKHIRYQASISNLSEELADRIMEPLGGGGWQLSWGTGLTTKWLLRQPAQKALVQVNGNWKSVQGTPPTGSLQGVKIAADDLASLDGYLEGVRYLIFEGPALETPCERTRLVYFIRDYLGDDRQALGFIQSQTHTVAKGGIVYGLRHQLGRITYLDHLPQLQLAARRGENPVFVKLVPDGAWVEGGKTYEHSEDLGFSIPEGARELKFYLLREGNLDPRFASIHLPKRAQGDVPVKMTLRQRPAQGRARLTLEAVHRNSEIQPIEVSWDQMEILKSRTEEQIIEELRTAKVEVPPTIPHPCHPFLWTWRGIGGNEQSLQDLVLSLPNDLDNPEIVNLDSIRLIRLKLTQFASPFKLSNGQHPINEKVRAISSDGDFPKAENGLEEATLERFDALLRACASWFTDGVLSRDRRHALVLLASWAFLRCPDEVKHHLIKTTQGNGNFRTQTYYNSMGRSLSEDDEIEVFFDVIASNIEDRADGRMMNYHFYPLFHLLSLREIAPKILTDQRAQFFAKCLVDRLREEHESQNYRVATRTCLRAFASLLRYRLQKPSFLDPEDDPIAIQAKQVLEQISATAGHSNMELAGLLSSATLEWLEKRGTNMGILQWEEGGD